MAMDIDLIVFKSELHKSDTLLKIRRPLISFFENKGKLTIIESEDYHHSIHSPNQYQESPITVCFIATGGTEEKFAAIAHTLPSPIIILCDAYHNSLAAALEISTWLSRQNIEYEFVNIPADYKDFGFLSLKLSCLNIKHYISNIKTHLPYKIDNSADTSKSAKKLSYIYNDEKVKKYLSESVIGLIGGESPWLISSKIDEQHIISTFGVKFVHISTDELVSEYKSIPEEEIDLNSFPLKYQKEFTADVKDALRMYMALCNLCNKYKITALTIKCFSLINTCFTTACLALSLLNDRGIISGCEGDIPALWTMMICHAISGGKASFMANPASASEEMMTIDFAHCTVPFSDIESYTLLSHFESGIGIGIAGKFHPDPCSIIKIGGKNLDKLLLIRGNILANTKVSQRCRTQIRVGVKDVESFEEFFSCKLGNHIIITPYLFKEL